MGEPPNYRNINNPDFILLPSDDPDSICNNCYFLCEGICKSFSFRIEFQYTRTCDRYLARERLKDSPIKPKNGFMAQKKIKLYEEEYKKIAQHNDEVLKSYSEEIKVYDSGYHTMLYSDICNKFNISSEELDDILSEITHKMFKRGKDEIFVKNLFRVQFLKKLKESLEALEERKDPNSPFYMLDYLPDEEEEDSLINICEKCGKKVKSMFNVCPSCGYEFRIKKEKK